MDIPLERRPLAPSELAQALGTGPSELPESHKLQKTQRSTSKVFITVEHLNARHAACLFQLLSTEQGVQEMLLLPHHIVDLPQGQPKLQLYESQDSVLLCAKIIGWGINFFFFLQY